MVCLDVMNEYVTPDMHSLRLTDVGCLVTKYLPDIHKKLIFQCIIRAVQMSTHGSDQLSFWSIQERHGLHPETTEEKGTLMSASCVYYCITSLL